MMDWEIVGRASEAKSFSMSKGDVTLSRKDFTAFVKSYAYDVLHDTEMQKELEEVLFKIDEDF